VCGELIDRLAAGTPVGKLLFVKALGQIWMPFTGNRPDHGARIERAAIDPHRCAAVAASICQH
jgi:hypothetical protein